MTAASAIELKKEEPRRTRAPSARLRWRMLRRLEEHLDVPMAALAIIWLVLLVIDLVRGSDGLLTSLAAAIWRPCSMAWLRPKPRA